MGYFLANTSVGSLPREPAVRVFCALARNGCSKNRYSLARAATPLFKDQLGDSASLRRLPRGARGIERELFLLGLLEPLLELPALLFVSDRERATGCATTVYQHFYGSRLVANRCSWPVSSTAYHL